MCSYSQPIHKDLHGSIEVGLAEADITPRSPIRLSGFAARSKTETDKVLQKLSAKAIAFGSDVQRPSVFITIDLIGIQWRVTSRLIEQLSKRMGMSQAQVVICATHTHGGPEIGCLISHLQCRGDYPLEYSFSDSLLELDQLIHIAEFNEMLSEKLEEVALAALRNRQPAFVAWGQGKASFAENRRTEGGAVDHALPVLRITNPDGSLRAVLVNYACHGISLGPDVNEIHGDWMGEAQKIIEARYPGAMALIAIGCAGDLHPVLRDKREYTEAYGKEIADKVESLLHSTGLQPLTEPPVGTMKWIKLPFSRVPSVPELIKLAKEDTTIKGYYARLALDRIQRGEAIRSELDYPVQTWSFGNKLIMVNLGGEVVVDYAVRLKNEWDASRLWINSYANDVSCYIASRRVIKEGGYEADASMYWYDKPSPLSEETEDLVVHTVNELIPPLFNKERHS